MAESTETPATVPPVPQQRNRLPVVHLQFGDGRRENITIEFGDRGEADDLTINSVEPPVDEEPQQQSETAQQLQNDSAGVSTGPTAARMLDSLLRSDIGSRRRSPLATAQDSASRNIILTVNYVYSATASPLSNDTTDATNNNASNRSGSLVLHVPNIPTDHDDESIQVLIRLATSIAFRTIASALKKQSGVSQRTFDTFPVLKLASLSETTCPICYDEFLDAKPVDFGSTKKRKRDDDENDNDNDNNDNELHPRKARTRSGGSVHSNSTGFRAEQETPKKAPKDQYEHVAVKMPCGHIFGRSCLSEWLKTNDTCPLCRSKVEQPETEANSTRHSPLHSNVTTLSLPNLAAVVSENQYLISNLANRPMTFFDASPLSTSTAATNTNPPRSNSDRRSPESGAGGLFTGALSGMGIMRRLVESIRAANVGNADGTRDGVRNMMAIFASASASPTVPDSNSRPEEPTVPSSPSPERPTNDDTPEEDPIFSIGVASRRTPNGVFTMPISNTNSSDNNNHNEEDNNLFDRMIDLVERRQRFNRRREERE